MKGLRRRVALAGTTGMAALGVLGGVAHADTSSTLSVVGTSDVSDSGLMPNLIQPEFEAAYPQFTFKYTGSATGVAIAAAEAAGSTTSPSVLIVHAASLENQFVAGGYSDNNAYGNAIFRNDFVLDGPATGEATKADVAANAANNIAQAFADIATAGVNGDATFVSRGGNTTASGTTVEEHQIWGLVYTAGLLPSGDSSNFVLCDVSAADGGGMSPISATVQSTAGQACPDSGTVSSTDAPSWYVVDTVSQAAAVEATNACTVGNGPANGNEDCYELTDRGTFDYLSSGGTASGGPSVIPNLAIVTRENGSSAPGGRYELINYFHAYIVSPNTGNPNLTAAEDFINFLTSPAFQSKVGTYLASTGDSDGAPFVADASPIITAAGLPSTVAPNTAVTVSGNVANAEIGYPTLADEPVSVQEVAGGLDIPISGATATTDNNGNYSITFTPPSSGSYQVVTGQISQVENSALTPIYGDILSPSASAATNITVASPAATPTTTVTTTTPATTVRTTTPAPSTVTVITSTDATISKHSIKRGKLTLDGKLSQAAPANATVELLAVQTARLSGARLTKPGVFKSVAKVTVKKGKKTFVLSAKLARGYRYNLQLAYVQKGRATTYSKLTSLSVS
jgi:ABC-type tungstate transport system permease subunit